ncbi:MAG: response regulator [Verrucomicrobia bacterium]|nr:response regulator [Verrucomicrobiota bacterium]
MTDSSGYEDVAAMIEREMRPECNTIIVADDEEIIRQRIVTSVMRLDPTILPYEASNGHEVLSQLASIRQKHGVDPILIILDLTMPKMDGWETIEHLKQEYEAQGRGAGIPIIVISAGTGIKRTSIFGKKSVHRRNLGYHPLITVAKNKCVRASNFDAAGDAGVLGWLELLVSDRAPFDDRRGS